MLGYISSTRKKSCRQCVKAKRRCDLGYPCCKRCFAKGLACAYPNAAVREAEVVIRQATPDLAPLPTEDAVVSVAEPPRPRASIDPALLQSSSSSSPESEADGELLHPRNRTPPPGSRKWQVGNSIPRELLPDVWAPAYLTQEQVVFVVRRMSSFVPTLVVSGHNAFIHRNLYSKIHPVAFDDSCAVSALYLAKTSQNIPVITRSIETKVRALVAASKTWTLIDHLAAVQAMVVYQTIRLFDPTLQAQPAGVSQIPLLESWTARLWKRSFNEPASFDSTWDAWIFYESLRRTVLMSVFLRGVWSCVVQDGLCDQIPVLAKLPLNQCGALWDVDESEFVTRAAESRKSPDCLVTYGDWVLAWQCGASDMSELTGFQRMLLAACRGRNDPRLISKTDDVF